MKNANFLSNPVSVATLLICGLFLLITSMKCNSGSATPPVNAAASFDKSSRSLTKSVQLDKFGKLLKEVGQDRLILEIYPVKNSSDPEKQDFDLVLVPLDMKGKPIGGPAATSLPESNTLNFLQFTNRQQIAVSDVSPGYQVVLEGSKLSVYSSLRIKIGFAPAMQSMAYISGGQTTMSSDSVPICKCPPGCPGISDNCVYETQMVKLIQKAYTLSAK